MRIRLFHIVAVVNILHVARSEDQPFRASGKKTFTRDECNNANGKKLLDTCILRGSGNHSWTNALGNCEDSGGYLLELRNESYDTEFRKLCVSSVLTWYWLGFVDNSSGSPPNRRWYHGGAFDPVMWTAPVMKRLTLTPPAVPPYCGRIACQPTNSGPKVWADSNCDHPTYHEYQFFCQYPMETDVVQVSPASEMSPSGMESTMNIFNTPHTERSTNQSTAISMMNTTNSGIQSHSTPQNSATVSATVSTQHSSVSARTGENSSVATPEDNGKLDLVKSESLSMSHNPSTAKPLDPPWPTTDMQPGPPVWSPVSSAQCQPDDWSAYGPCSATCGRDAIRIRSRKFTKNGLRSNECPQEERQSAECSVQPCRPMSGLEASITDIMFRIGLTFLIGALSASILAATVKRIWTRSAPFMPILQLNCDLSFLIAVILVSRFGYRDGIFGQDTCKVAAAAIQYFYLVAISFQLIEALYVYCMLTAVIVTNDTPVGLKKAIAACWGVPIVIVGITAIAGSQHLTADFSCWLNNGDNVTLCMLFSNMAISIPAVVMLEASGFGKRGGYTPAIIPCAIARSGLLLDIGLQTTAWYLGTMAVYYQKSALYAILFGLNVALGSVILAYHFFADELVINAIKGGFKKLCRRKEPDFPPHVHIPPPESYNRTMDIIKIT